MRRVVIESPYAGDIESNVRYARACLVDCFERGEAPFASHLLYTQNNVLDDSVPHERRLGITAGFLWASSAQATVVYTDLGVSQGMVEGMRDAQKWGRPIEFRKIEGWANEQI